MATEPAPPASPASSPKVSTRRHRQPIGAQVVLVAVVVVIGVGAWALLRFGESSRVRPATELAGEPGGEPGGPSAAPARVIPETPEAVSDQAVFDAIRTGRTADLLALLVDRWEGGQMRRESLPMIAELALRVGNLELAREAIGQSRATPEVPEEHIRALRAGIATRAGQTDEAIALLKDLAWERIRPEAAEWLRTVALLPNADRCLQDGRPARVLEFVAFEYAAAHPQVFDRRFAALVALGRADDAERLVRRAAPMLGPIRGELARSDVERVAGRAEGARRHLAQAIELAGRTGSVGVLLAAAHRAVEMQDEALFGRALDAVWAAGAGPEGDVALWRAQLVRWVRDDRLAEALELARALHDRTPGSALDGSNRLWTEVMADTCTPEHLAFADRLVEAIPGEPNLAAIRALVALRLGRTDVARAALVGLPEIAPANRPPSLVLAEALLLATTDPAAARAGLARDLPHPSPAEARLLASAGLSP